jgi:hypothetical protein
MSIRLLFFVSTSTGCLAGSTLSGNTSRSTLSVRGVGGEINVFLRSGTHVKGRNVHELTAHTDVALTDQDTGVVDSLGKTLLVHLGLKTSFQQLLGSQLQDEIELKFLVGEKSIATHASKERSTLENTLGIIRFQGQQSTGSLTQLGQSVLNPPDFALAAQAVFTDQFELGIKTFLLVRTTGSLERLAV